MHEKLLIIILSLAVQNKFYNKSFVGVRELCHTQKGFRSIFLPFQATDILHGPNKKGILCSSIQVIENFNQKFYTIAQPTICLQSDPRLLCNNPKHKNPVNLASPSLCTYYKIKPGLMSHLLASPSIKLTPVTPTQWIKSTPLFALHHH